MLSNLKGPFINYREEGCCKTVEGQVKCYPSKMGGGGGVAIMKIGGGGTESVGVVLGGGGYKQCQTRNFSIL